MNTRPWWWQPDPVQALQEEQARSSTPQPEPQATPEQIILATLQNGDPWTQGNLRDRCQQSGVILTYAALRMHLAQLQRQGMVQSRFSDQIIPGLSVLVYCRSRSHLPA